MKTNARPRFIDIHILQSVPFSNLNRDDTNSVKTVQYGNTRRTRVSSQCWKRATRVDFEKMIGEGTLRTRRIGERVTQELEARGWPKPLAERAGAHIAAGSSIKFELAKQDDNPKQIVPNKVLTNAMVYVPTTAAVELANLADEYRGKLEDAKDIKKPSDKSALPVEHIEAVLRTRNPTINLFGRMLAEVDQAGVDGAVQVAHALTTHETDLEVDYFSAVDDVTQLWNDSSGSGHMGHTEFSAGTFYRYSTIDLLDLASNVGDPLKNNHAVLKAFISSFIESLPQAKKNATAPHTIPALVHLSVRSDRPLSYAAAFEEPVRATSKGGYTNPSIDQLAAYARAANKLLGDHRIISSGWASTQTKDLTGLGNRYDSLDELTATTLHSAIHHATSEATE